MFDADCYDAYYKYARAYIGVNPQLSIDMLTKLKANHPELLEVNRELANAYYQAGYYGKAKSAYDEFMQQGTPDAQDYGYYAMLLYLNKDYAQSLKAVEKGLATDKDNHLLKRLRMYDLYEIAAYKEGLEAADAFLTVRTEATTSTWTFYTVDVCHWQTRGTTRQCNGLKSPRSGCGT